jgi:hypothetical protein
MLRAAHGGLLLACRFRSRRLEARESSHVEADLAMRQAVITSFAKLV